MTLPAAVRPAGAGSRYPAEPTMTDQTAKPSRGKCPKCNREFTFDLSEMPGHLPFCSQRCQWVDLGRWLDEEYRISRDLLADDAEQAD